MIGVYVISEYESTYEQAETKEQLKRQLLDKYNVHGYKYTSLPDGNGATTFNRYFKGVKAAKA